MEFMFYDPWSDLFKVREHLKRLQDEIYDPWEDDDDGEYDEECEEECDEEEKGEKCKAPEKKRSRKDVVPLPKEAKKTSGPLAILGMKKGREMWWPAVDLKETETGYELHAELPGVKKEDVHIELRGQGPNKRLVVSGKKDSEEKKEGDHWHRVERSFGEFQRSFTVPADTVSDDIKAKFEDGMLRVSFPKPKPVEPTKIEIQ